jgi:hypothetical protein
MSMLFVAPSSRRITHLGVRPVAGRIRVIAAATPVLAAAIWYVGAHNPHDSRALMPRCPIKALTGWDCPGCGGLRLTHDLLHGQWAMAWHDNAVLLALAPLLIYLAATSIARWSLGQRVRLRPSVGITLGVIGTSWMLVRNLVA